MGATKDRLTAAQAYMAYEAGGYPGSPIGAGMMCIFSPYDVPNVLIDGFDVLVNKPKTAPYGPWGDQCRICFRDGRRRAG